MRNGVLQWVLLVSIWVLSGASATALAQSAADTEPVRFTAQGLPTPQKTDSAAIAQRRVLQAYLKKNPHVEVEPFAMPEVGQSAMDMGPLMAIAAGIPPHAIYVNFRQSSTYISQGFLEPLEILLARTRSDDPEARQADASGRWLADPSAAEVAEALELIRARVPERAWPVVYREDESGRYPGKHVWSLPTGTLVMALWYRKDLFAAAGLDPSRPPETWEEMLEYARRLTVPERQQYGLMISGGQTLSWGAYTFLVSNGARAVQQTEDGSWIATYGSREAAEAVSYLWEMANAPFERDGQRISGAVRIGSDTTLMWDRGQVAMRFAYLDDQLLGDINPQLVGIAPVPRAPGGSRGSELNCRMLGVFSGSTPGQKLAVMDYLWFVTSDEAAAIRTESYVQLGFGQFVNPDLLEKFGYDRVLRLVPESWKNAFQAAVVNGVPEPYGRNTQNIYRYMSEPIAAALEMDFEGVAEEERVRRILTLMEASEEGVNQTVLGNIPADVLLVRRIVGSAVLLLVISAFVAGAVHVWRYFSKVTSEAQEDRPLRRYVFGYVLLIPALLLTALWLYMPLAWGLGLSMVDYRLVMDSVFVGVDNFSTALFDERFWGGFGRTFYFVSLTICLGFWPPILLAILLDEVPTATLKYIFRTIFYLPAIISGVVIMFLWKELYDPSPYGVLNQLLLSLNGLGPVLATIVKWVALGLWISLIGMLLMLPIKIDEMGWGLRLILWSVAAVLSGVLVYPVIQNPATVMALWGRFDLEALRWIDSPDMAMLCVVIPTVWAGAGPGCLLYLAALKTIPSDLYEAADIDGATNWHKVFYVTLPRLKYLIGIQFIAAVIAAFKGGTDFILALTGGGPNNSTMILALEIFITTFGNLRFGLGAAMAWILGAVLIGFTAYQLKMLARAEFTTAK